MNFLSMKYFVVLAEERSFTKAAEKLHVTQQTLSAHVAGLEKESGAKLFIRHVPLELTDAGRVFYRYARIIRRNEMALERELTDAAGMGRGTLRIGVAPSRGQVVLTPGIESFRKSCPGIRIRLVEMANDMLWTALARDEIDLVLARAPEALPGIACIPFAEEYSVLYLSDDLAEALWGEKKGEILSSLSERNRELPESFAECPFLLNSESDITGALARRLFRDAAIDPVIAVESESMGTMLKLCVDGAGAYFCPESLAEKLLPRSAQKKLHRITFEDGKYEISFGYQKSAERWSMIGRFIEEAFKSRGKKFPLAKP